MWNKIFSSCWSTIHVSNNVLRGFYYAFVLYIHETNLGFEKRCVILRIMALKETHIAPYKFWVLLFINHMKRYIIECDLLSIEFQSQ